MRQILFSSAAARLSTAVLRRSVVLKSATDMLSLVRKIFFKKLQANLKSVGRSRITIRPRTVPCVLRLVLACACT